MKPRFLVPLGVFAVLVVVLIVGLSHSRQVGVLQSPLVGHEIPEWHLPLLTDPGRTLGSQQLRGQWYVLNFWGTWCYACRAEHSMLLQAQRDARVQIIGVDWKDENSGDAVAWLSQLGNPFTQVVTDKSGDTAINLGVAAAPESFLVNPQGVIVYKEPGVITAQSWKREFLARLPPQSTVPAGAGGGS